MEACATVAEFLRAPVGRRIAGRSWLYFYPRLGLCGFGLFGRPNDEDMLELTRVLAVELDQPRHVSLVDARRVEDVEPAAFATLQRYVGEHHQALARVVARLGLVRPHGLMGAAAAGFFGVQPPPYPVEVFDEVAPALAWLDVVADFRAELDDAIADVTGAPAIVARLRVWIGQHLEAPSIAEAAAALGTSARSLQRRLREEGTSFQREVNATRVHAATAMLRDGEASLTRIAIDVGCGSLATFSALFRRLTGETPSRCRARSRPPPGS